MNWGYFLPWMSCWAGTMAFCGGVGWFCGYWAGRDRAEDDATDALEAALAREEGRS